MLGLVPTRRPAPTTIVDDVAVDPRPRLVPRQRPGPVGGKRDENRRRQTAALAAAGLRLFLRDGIEAVTVEQIVDEAQVAKGSFYRYFGDKADLVEALFAPTAREVHDAFARCERALSEAGPGESLSAAYQALAFELTRLVRESPDLVRLYLQESRGPTGGARGPVARLADEILDGATRLSEVAMRHGLVRPVGARLSAVMVVGAVELLVARGLVGDDLGPPAEVPVHLIALVLDGVRARGV
jgi:AcrR family transcriptional regulator